MISIASALFWFLPLIPLIGMMLHDRRLERERRDRIAQLSESIAAHDEYRHRKQRLRAWNRMRSSHD